MFVANFHAVSKAYAKAHPPTNDCSKSYYTAK